MKKYKENYLINNSDSQTGINIYGYSILPPKKLGIIFCLFCMHGLMYFGILFQLHYINFMYHVCCEGLIAVRGRERVDKKCDRTKNARLGWYFKKEYISN